MIYWDGCELEREQVRLQSLLTIVFKILMICVYNVFDEMAARIQFWILKRFLVGVLGWCWWVCRCLGFESWVGLSGFWKGGIFPYDKDSILNCHLNHAFESFWMITKWGLIPCYEYNQGVQRSRKVSVSFWKFETAKVGMGKLVKVTIPLFYLFWFTCL